MIYDFIHVVPRYYTHLNSVTILYRRITRQFVYIDIIIALQRTKINVTKTVSHELFFIVVHQLVTKMTAINIASKVTICFKQESYLIKFIFIYSRLVGISIDETINERFQLHQFHQHSFQYFVGIYDVIQYFNAYRIFTYT